MIFRPYLLISPEQRWLAANREKYAGQWVALDGEELLAASEDFEEVYRVVKNMQPAPLVTRVEELQPVPIAGW